ncbi:hypothetical protein ACFXOS_13960 [Streptomyces sp. NPDC059175]|uniref:hypothetical protein n=1 Tax=Streptomyces sp. NPDC059175 TaxID=3346757 RepID=UPI0036943419
MTIGPDTPTQTGPHHTGTNGRGTVTPGPSGGHVAIPAPVRETVEQIVLAVESADDARIRRLLADLAPVADSTALMWLRQRLYDSLPRNPGQ